MMNTNRFICSLPMLRKAFSIVRRFNSLTSTSHRKLFAATPSVNSHDRFLHTTARCMHGEYEMKDPASEEEVVMITVVNKEGKVTKIRGKTGDNLLYLGKRFEVDIEGACEASLACTTCHVYVDYDFVDTIPLATETEEDLLDAAPFLRDNSRLGCQIILAKEHNGITFTLPSATRNFYVDGHKPSHH